MTAPKVELHLYYAAISPLAVILRRGPSKHFRMILWDRSDDSFQDGQWLKQKIYPERCHLSPDGKHFIFFALSGRWDERTQGAYFAISRPPYFTALALFPVGDTWTSGGRFVTSKYFLVEGQQDIIGLTEGLERVYLCQKTASEEPTLLLADGRAPKIGKSRLRNALNDEKQIITDNRFAAKDGCLYRVESGQAKLIRDFTDMEFEKIRAPYDHRPDNGPKTPVARSMVVDLIPDPRMEEDD